MPAVITQSICAFALASASTPSPEDPATREAFRMGFTLLGLVAVIGVLLVFGAALLFVLARNRRAQRDLDRRLNRPSSRADAWSAAGARAEPIHPDPDLPADDDLARPADDDGFDADPNADTDTDLPPPF